MTLATLLDRSSPLPLYEQVKRRLQRMILAWPAGDDRFHSDHELCATFGVSRATIRQALAALEQEGLLRRVQGFGTFVNRLKIEEQFNPQMNFIDQWARSGRELRVEMLGIAKEPCPEPFATLLRLPAGEPALFLERYRLSGSLRIAYDRRYIPLPVAEGMSKRALKMVSLLDALATVVTLDRGDIHIEAALAGEDIAERLELLPGDPVLQRQLVYFDSSDQPVMAGLSTYRADQVRYAVSVAVSLEAPRLNAEIRSIRSAPRTSQSHSNSERKSG